MAGRGRGRRPFGTDPSISRGEGLPPGLQQPTPVFPVMEQKPLPLAGGEEAEYLLALKQDFRGVMKNLPFFIKPAAAQRDVQRYSDKYHSSEQTNKPSCLHVSGFQTGDDSPESCRSTSGGESEKASNPITQYSGYLTDSSEHKPHLKCHSQCLHFQKQTQHSPFSQKY
uniref:Uncharacterized protein n=1 Tax=Oryzias latipes TaxID=8090 RepID=A0A3P9JD24_ORYLA